jgi:hypothetical protein
VLLVDGAVEGAPGGSEELVYAGPVGFGDAALFGARVADGHGLGAEARVLRERQGGDAVEF